ncbi:phage head-tail adapter protein [Bacillus sp. Au-Bac7]|uniref:phage head-tail adapter protein n=1 Tax=Bacillus sp. Au-Bac7 TaxID=2906458 RepID=UPI001E426A0E|nr:phage head-tail adapter protein [Bacillus sp. Au-Bac7]MCE4052022.1 phage head-tail adapter protein [Bacillus sp. Au-Bac7]
MRPFKYTPPRASTGDLRTPIKFYQYAPNSGPEPGEGEDKLLYTAWAKVDNVWMKDLELAKSNGTLSDLTITIRNPQAGYIPTNKHYMDIDAPEYVGKRYNVKQVQPDLQNTGFITIVGELNGS